MVARGIHMALALSALFPVVTAAQGHPAPSAEVVSRLRRHHHLGDWWRVTTESARFEARVSMIDTEGLAGLDGHFATRRPQGRRSGDRAIEHRVGRAPERHGARGKARLGRDGFERRPDGGERSACDLRARGVARGRDRSGDFPRDGQHAGDRTRVPSPLDAGAAADRWRLRNVPRLRLEHRARGIGWAARGDPLRIGAVPRLAPLGPDRPHEVHGGNASRGALSGALSLGSAAGLLGAMDGAALGSDQSESGSVAAEVGLAAFGVGAGVGLLLGGAIGATISGWHLVYHRP